MYGMNMKIKSLISNNLTLIVTLPFKIFQNLNVNIMKTFIILIRGLYLEKSNK